ncbi:hypothetical protein [Marispirochaeta sp.]|uniref:hypothetical protein n=1 Tax=Marispirochaeta sp. TaxID=2038653 RepID=UPI0029C7370E|nr:hypothetical protein [Marispirochaeta sp.]
MNKVVVQTYTALMILILVSVTTYVLYDLTQLTRSNYNLNREHVTKLAMLILSGGSPEGKDMDGVLRIDLVRGEGERVLYRSEALSTSLLSLFNGSYEYSMGSWDPDAVLRIRTSLLDREEFLPRLRILLYTASTAVLLSGFILAFAPRSAAKDQNAPVPAAAPADTAPGHGSELMPKEQLAMRLESELKRAASFDQDLTVAIIAFEGLDPARGLDSVSSDIRQFFVFRDLCYGYGPAQVCLLLPNTELDDGIRTVRDFRKQIEKKKPDISAYGGLSSRGGRLLDPELLLTEAGSALKKSRRDDERAIFGFRADPEKYRALLAEC